MPVRVYFLEVRGSYGYIKVDVYAFQAYAMYPVISYAFLLFYIVFPVLYTNKEY